MSKANWKLIGEAESFAAGCDRSRLELRLVDALKDAMADARIDERTMAQLSLLCEAKDRKIEDLEREVLGLEAVIAEAKRVAVGYILKVHAHPSQIIERLNRSPEAALRIKAETEAKRAKEKSDG